MNRKKAHFIGIAGMGMSATAILLKEQGWQISGSDAESYPPATSQLDKHGISYKTSYDSGNIPSDADVIVIGKNTRLKRENNAEVRAARESGIRIVNFPELLGEILNKREPIVVAGSYGKSTCSSLIAWCLSQSSIDVGWFIGAAPKNMEPSHLGTHPVFILEGDEYPTSHDDPRPKFAHYNAHDCLITAAVHDHVNIYKTQREFLEPFRALVSGLPDDGILVLCADEPYAASLAKDTRARVVAYGMTNTSEWHAKNILRGETTGFDLMRGKDEMVRLSTSLLGDHNIQNMVGISAMLLEKELVTPKQLAEAIRNFEGLARRLEKKTATSSAPAYEGFGSSGEKLQAAIKALKVRYPDKRLVIIFEPHSFSWRNKNMLHWFDTAFNGADLVILYKSETADAETRTESTEKEMTQRLSEAGITIEAVTKHDEAIDALSSNCRADDVILLSSSGAMDGLIESIPKWLDEKFGA